MGDQLRSDPTEEPADDATNSRRQRLVRVAIVCAVVVAVIAATWISSARLLRIIFPDLDLVAYASLFITCWIGAGGALVPIPGVRLVSWLMIIQQGAALDPVLVALTAAVAMSLGQTSYFLTSRAAAARVGAGSSGSPEPQTDDESANPDMSRRARYISRARERVERQLDAHAMLTVFAVSALPTPMTTITTTLAAAHGMPYRRFWPASFAGFLVFAALLAGVGQALVQLTRSIFHF